MKTFGTQLFHTSTSLPLYNISRYLLTYMSDLNIGSVSLEAFTGLMLYYTTPNELRNFIEEKVTQIRMMTRLPFHHVRLELVYHKPRCKENINYNVHPSIAGRNN